MIKTAEIVKYDNKSNPNSAFDIVTLEQIHSLAKEEHDIEKVHIVDFYIILLITEGVGKHSIDFKNFEIKKGSLITVRKNQIHRFYQNKALKGYAILFKDEFLSSYLETLEEQKTLQLFNELLGSPKLQLQNKEFSTVLHLAERINQEYYSTMDDFSLEIIRSELHILILKLFRIKSKRDKIKLEKKYLLNFIEFQTLVEKNVIQTNKVADYAKMLAISTKTLNTISKSIVNQTAKDFIDEIHIMQIKRLLINTTLTVKEIAYSSGFEETTNFYKYFKRKMNTTPEKFRLTF